MSMDTTYVNELLNIIEKATAHSGKLSHIASEALGELIRINNELRLKAVEIRRQQEAKLQAAPVPVPPRAIPSNQSENPQAPLFPTDSGTSVSGDVERKV